MSQSEQGVADLARLGEAERLELRRIEAALARIDEGRWGECAECGRAIEPKRLEALPWAIRCAGCAEARERGVKVAGRLARRAGLHATRSSSP